MTQEDYTPPAHQNSLLFVGPRGLVRTKVILKSSSITEIFNNSIVTYATWEGFQMFNDTAITQESLKCGQNGDVVVCVIPLNRT